MQWVFFVTTSYKLYKLLSLESIVTINQFILVQHEMAHDGLALTLVVLGLILVLSFYLGPNREVRAVKRLEGKIMLIPSAIILFILAGIIYSGIIG